MRVAVLGAGNWGKNLVANLYDLGRLAAVAEPSIDLRKTLKSQYPDVTLYDNHQEIMDSDIPAIAIATPVATHYELVKIGLEKGKDVFVEKPITLKTSEAEDLARMADRENRILMVGHLLLYQPAIEFIKKSIADGLIGELKGLHQERLNLGRARSVENVMWSFGVHDIAVLNYLIASPLKDFKVIGHKILQEAVDDDVYLHMTFKNGVQAHLHSSWLWPEKQRKLVVVGAKGMLVYDELAQTVVHHRKTIDTDLSNKDKGQEIVFQGEAQPLRLEMQHFLNAIKTRSKPFSDGWSAVEVIGILESASKVLEEK